MTISVGDTIPFTTFSKMVDGEITHVEGEAVFKGRNVVLFGLPGAYTGTCENAHLPSFMRAMDDLKAKGVDEVICLANNDPWVMDAWSKSTGGAEAGITFLTDPAGDFAEAIDMLMEVPAIGFHRRSQRYAMQVIDGKVTVWNPEDQGSYGKSGAEAMLDAI